MNRTGTDRTRSRALRWRTMRRGGALALAAAGLCFSCGVFDRNPAAGDIAGPQPDAPRIAMLPIDNTGASEYEYFAYGMTDEITDRLTMVNGLAVISRSSVAAVSGDLSRLQATAEELGTEYLLLSSLEMTDGPTGETALDLKSRLIRAADGSEIWSATYRRPVSDVFEIQAEIVRGVAQSLGVSLQESERLALQARPTANLQAYEAYLRGLSSRWSFEHRELETAEELFARAVELDPDFALAHAALSEVHSQIFHFRYDRSPQRLADAVAAAHRALEIEPGLAQGHRALGHYYYWGQRNFAEALSEFTIAVEGRPSDALVVGSIGIVLRRQGRWDEALETFRRAAQVDPKSEVNALDLASTCGRMRRYEEGLAHCRRAIELAPGDIFPYVFCARMLRFGGDLAGAREMLDRMPEKDPTQRGFYRYEQAVVEHDFPTALRELDSTSGDISDPISEEVFPRDLAECECRVYAGNDGSDVNACVRARDRLERMREESPGDAAVHAALGWAYALSGEEDQAVMAGERAVELLPVSADAMAGHSYLVRLAKIYARADKPYLSVKTTQKALALPGWLSIATVEADPAWDPIRDDPRFRELLRMHGAVE